ncbi:MAG: tRNA uridine-5-carboxymethylaminomethyl(34) synthesis GTPase MnmE [Bdellovibrionales bacterium]|nr:tRNA uridine-5-carboxymethylaminomethyl(34) synthesis GTPase MnmE [Bdellovibrionales bacterium]
MSTETTIAALATAPFPGGIAIIRVSGADAKNLAPQTFSSSESPIASPRKMIFGNIVDPIKHEVIDQGLCVFMPAPNSYTGEDVVEYQMHGSLKLAEKLLTCLYSLGAEPAEPGEFTKRAFLNGKIDLAQAEAVNDLINASSEKASKVAADQLAGRFSSSIEEIGEPLRNALAELEAAIDFPDEDIKPDGMKQISEIFKSAKNKIEVLLDSYDYGLLLKEGLKVLLAGRPNAGKSSLLNKLLGAERAIVTEISGTTRDLIEESSLIEGYPFVFCDSAGLTNTTDKVEKIGIELAYNKLNWADLILFVIDASEMENLWLSTLTEIVSKKRKIWLIVNKIDLETKAIGRVYCDSSLCQRNFYISAKNGEGIESLKKALVEEISTSIVSHSDSSGVITNTRHKACLMRAKEALTKAIDASTTSMPAEIICAELQLALYSLEEIVGKTYTEDILGRIFSKFCIGK